LISDDVEEAEGESESRVIIGIGEGEGESESRIIIGIGEGGSNWMGRRDRFLNWRLWGSR